MTSLNTTHKVVRYNIVLRTFAMMGLPPLEGSMVAYERNALVIAMRNPGVTDGQVGEQELLGMEESATATRALERYTELKAQNHVRGTGFVVRAGVIEISLQPPRHPPSKDTRTIRIWSPRSADRTSGCPKSSRGETAG
jgi:hypothetical protein